MRRFFAVTGRGNPYSCLECVDKAAAGAVAQQFSDLVDPVIGIKQHVFSQTDFQIGHICDG